MAKKGKKSASKAHEVRIIAGKWRGQKVSVIEQNDLRPTTDRVRETLFNWLALPIVNARCLDAFAGSAILSFEALSREAASVVAVEQSRAACQAIKNSPHYIQSQNMTLIETNILHYLGETKESFDVIFLDPPFANVQLLVDALELIIARKLLATDGYLYVEMSTKDVDFLDAFQHKINWLKKKTAGQVCYALAHLNEELEGVCQ